MGTRSRPDCSERFENDSTAPPPPRISAVSHGSVAGGPAVSPVDNDGRMPHAPALAALTLLVAAPPWNWPVDPPHVIVRPYIAPRTPYSAGHRGIDLAAPTGTVYAPADGVVHFAGTVVDRPVLSIEQPGGVLTSYEPVATTLTAGATVERGEVIGTVVPGHCASLCLHFGVRVHGDYASPLAWLGGIEPAVLLPTRRPEGRWHRGELGKRPPTVEGHGSGVTLAARGRAPAPPPAEGVELTRERPQ